MAHQRWKEALQNGLTTALVFFVIGAWSLDTYRSHRNSLELKQNDVAKEMRSISMVWGG
jgi:hypothetical protein